MVRWWESPLVLALAGALAIHTIAIVAFDVVIVYTPHRTPEIAPHVELVDIDLPPPPPPKPVAKPEPKPEPEPEPEPEKKVAPAPPQRVASTQPHTSAPTAPDRPPDPIPRPPDRVPGGGGDPYKLAEDSSRDGVGQRGTRTSDRLGTGGGGGGGVGSGSGSGSGVEAVRPVSVATIKTAAKPKGDYAYFDDGKRYPEEAKQLGIEGVIKVQLIVDETGKIKRSRLLTKLGHGLDELALEHAGQLAFEPARDTDDRPVASVVVWTFHMTLPK
jgi:protein TonB